MKKVNLFFTIAALVLISFSTIAAADAPATIYISKARETKKIVLNLENMSADKVTCEFIAEDGEIIFTDVVETANKTAKQYDLSQLPSGDYTIEVNDLMKIERLNLSISNKNVTLEENVSDITFKPTVWLNEDNTVDFNLLMLGKSATLAIYAPNGEVLKTDRFRKANVASKRYNLNNLEAGEYRVVVFHKGETFVYTLNL